MRPHEHAGPQRAWQPTLPRRHDLTEMALAGLFPAEAWLEHLLDRIEGGRP